jgi:uncharacterized membrane protein YdbT with pleckstrin-like domain
MTELAANSSEEVQWSGTVSHFHYLGKWLIVLLLIAGLVASYLLEPLKQFEFVNIARIIAGVLVVIFFFWIQTDRSRRKYTVTGNRVIVEYGIISKRSNEIRVQDIRSINLVTSGLPGLLGIGRVEFASAATEDAEVVFWHTPEAQKVRDLVRSLQSTSPDSADRV